MTEIRINRFGQQSRRTDPVFEPPCQQTKISSQLQSVTDSSTMYMDVSLFSYESLACTSKLGTGVVDNVQIVHVPL